MSRGREPNRTSRSVASTRLGRSTGPPGSARTRSARQLGLGSGILALSVLADSGLEHYRGSFQNRAMYVPLAVAALTLGVSAFATLDNRPRRHAVRDAVYGAAAVAGVAGFGFHLYNITKRPGRFSWLNLFYAAPIGAPFALVLAGLLGKSAERVRSPPGASRACVFGLPEDRALAALSAIGLFGSAAEAALLHFRGAFHNPAMTIPVSAPPLAAAALACAAIRPARPLRRLARWWLRLTALIGCAGVGFQAYGVSRAMGGWKNWSQNVLNGPPLPAPPAFTGLAIAGLGALGLMEPSARGRSRS
jgi:hypothetical protein